MRKLDGKFHITKDKIINISSGEVISEDEPLFLFRARDWLALKTLDFYLDICKDNKCVPEQIAAVEREIKKFENFRKIFTEQMKQPGITMGKKNGQKTIP